jgi:hypothetical protein
MKVETYSSNVGIDAPVAQGMNPRTISDGGMGALAQGLNQAAQAFHQEDMRQKHILDQQSEEEAKLWSLNTMSDMRQRMLVNLEDAKNNAPDGADGFAGQQNQVYESALQNILKEAPNRRAKALFEAHARDFQNTYFAHALTFESGEKQRKKLQGITDGAKSESNEIDMAANPTEAYLRLVPQRLEFIDSLREDPATRAKIKDGITTHYSKTLVLAEGRRDPVGTLAKIDDGIYAKMPGWNLYGDQLESLRRGIEARANRQESSKSALIKDAYEEWKAQLSRKEVDANGKLTPPDFGYSDADVEKALGPIAFKHYKEEREFLPIAQTYTSAMAVSDPEYAGNALKRIRSDIESGKLTAGLGNRLEEYVTKAAQENETFRKKDPAAASDIAARRIFGDDYLNGNRADQLLLREGTQIARFGTPAHNIRLLTDDEAKTMARDLSGMSVDKAQEWMRNLEAQMQPSGKIAVNFQGKDGANTDSKRLTTQVMSELFSYGKLDKGFMFMNFTADTKYGNYFAKAMRIKDDEQLTTGLPQTLTTEIKKSIDENSDLKKFTQVMRMSAGEAGAEYASVLEKLIRRTAYMTAGDASSPDASSLVKNIVEETITNQIKVNGTYYVPSRDHATGRPLDAAKIDQQLKIVGEAWLNTRGERFIPDVRSSNRIIQGSPAQAENVNNPRDGSYVWLSLEDGSGVYRAVRLRGSSGSDLPGAYAPVLDANKQRYELRFKELPELVNLLRNPKLQSSGKIR